MKKQSLLICLVLALLFTGLAIADDLEDTIKGNLNKIDLSQAPGIFRFLLGSPKVNLEVTRENGSISVFGFVIKNSAVQEFKAGGVEKPDYIIKIHEKHMTEKALNTLPELYSSGEIQIVPKTFFSKIKLRIVKLFI
ncbi:hypothetical protein D6745_03505 [Candidatus Woesearchaeota archaeon]|nr:MAG: hypothetical protein D6745_03505 [Candidatus Woesearchaeota archaeon]